MATVFCARPSTDVSVAPKLRELLCTQDAFTTSADDVDALRSERDAAFAEVAGLRARLAEMQQTASVVPAVSGQQTAASATSPEDAAMQVRSRTAVWFDQLPAACCLTCAEPNDKVLGNVDSYTCALAAPTCPKLLDAYCCAMPSVPCAQMQLLQLELDDLRQERGDLELRTQQASFRSRPLRVADMPRVITNGR